MKKPYNGKEIEEYLKVDPSQVMLVGDRLLTDIYLGNMMRWKSVLVKPI